jgi:phage terminase large subunit GpA-like protein
MNAPSEEVVELVDDAEWLARRFEELTTELNVVKPSEWAETNRYLPASVSNLPGYYRFSVNPFMREIVDCMAVDSPVREVAVMKGVQVTYTTATIENVIGYFIEHVKTAPCMLVTADAELAKLRMEVNVRTMIRESGLEHLIRSSDSKNRRKTGNTDQKIEWAGGGYLVPLGAKNPSKMRSTSSRVLCRDEIDAWPLTVGKDGDPIQLTADRCAAYEGGRKILDGSTPTLKSTSAILKRFKLGDQRYYYVRCLKCRHPQVLRWQRVDDEGVLTGIVWETGDDGMLVTGSVRYLCEKCHHPHRNEDKAKMFAEDNAEWRPTAKAANPWMRSYHISGLYSPPGMRSWEICVSKYLEAFDPETKRAKSIPKLQAFYNNVLGEPFEVRGRKLRFESVSAHRRQEYRFGDVPNRWLIEQTGGPALVLTSAVDVHKSNLAVSVFAWGRGRRAVLVDYWRYEGDAEQLSDPATWARLRRLVESKEYTADDGKLYRPEITLVDSSYSTDLVYGFCSEYEAGVYPVKGRDVPPKSARIKEFSPFQTTMGTQAYSVTVDLYKERWSSALRRSWQHGATLPAGSFSAPIDVTDKQLKELIREKRVAKKHNTSGETVGFKWLRDPGADNELWDLLMYNSAALDMIAHDTCTHALGLEAVSWTAFEHHAESRALFWATADE